MDKDHKERLEQELRFLKESLEAEVISKEEYEKGKQRIENKLRELEEQEKTSQESPGILEEVSEATPSEEVVEKEITEEKIEITEIKEEPQKIKEEPEGPKPKVELWVEGKEEKPAEEAEKKEEIKEEPEEEITFSKKWLYGIVIIIVLAILFFSIRSYTKNLPEKEITDIKEKFTPACSLDSDCKEEGKIGICINPDTKEAKCEFKEDKKIELIVINDKNCDLCDSLRMKGVIQEIFPNVDIKEIDYGILEAKKLTSTLGIDALPAYIFNSSITETTNFKDFERALLKKGDNYIVTNAASGANYYFKRNKINSRLDVFLTPDMEEKVDRNLNEFLELFKDNISFTKHIVTESEKTKFKDELGITSYPTFLINNQLKFSGLNSADSIKEKFCKLNNIDKCKKELRKNII